jgi:DNA ligase (NAD+)
MRTLKKKRIQIHNKTLKKKAIYNELFKIKNIEVIGNDNIKLNLKNDYYNSVKPNMIYNQTFVKLLEEIAQIKVDRGEFHRSRAYTKAADKIVMSDTNITNMEELKSICGIGKSVYSKLNEYVKSGKIKYIEDAKMDPAMIFTRKIYGIGPKKAMDLVNTHKILTIESLIQRQNDVLNDKQKIGLKYYEDINKRIPRDEIKTYETKLNIYFNQVKNEKSEFKIVGSYRRGALESGDIDIIVMDPQNDVNVFHKYLDLLIEKGIIIEVLSKGDVKSLCISKIRGKPARRIDFMFTPKKEYAFAELYFTGNKNFNTVMRAKALTLGYSMNEHGLYKMENGVKTTKLSKYFPTEKDVFKFLGLVYKSPKERTGANAIEHTERTMQKLESIILSAEQTKLEKYLQKGIDSLTETETNDLLIEADKAYYGENENSIPLMNDAQYDMLKEHAEENYPDCEALSNIAHAIIKVQKNKIKLPYEMWSLDKEKTVKGVDRRISKYPGKYLISAKADGISVLYDVGNKKLYSRGNGTYGQDLSFMIPYLGLPESDADIVIRGELIIKKDTFEKKYKGQFANPRNFVAGVANAKKMNVKMVKDLDILTYEVIQPKITPIEQMEVLSKLLKSNVIKHLIVDSTDIDNEFLSKLLLDWRENYPWEIDGVVVCQDEIHDRVSGNPKHAFAFKMVLSDQIVEARVVDVLWTPSQQGYVKPKIRIKPVEIGGVKIEYATGHNAAFIFRNKINIGSVIQLIRSGDVIPKVHKVLVPSEKGKGPPSDMEVVWNTTKIDLILKDIAKNHIVLMKSIAAFFDKIGVVGLGRGNIQRIIDKGFNSIPKIVAMTVDDFLTVEGFKEKLSNKIYSNIRNSIEKTSIESLMAGTNIFGRGMGEKRIRIILTEYSDILWSEESDEEKLKKVANLPGFKDKTAESFVPYIGEFMKFVQKIGLMDQIRKKVPKKIDVDTSHPLNGKKVVFTGIRDNILQQKLETFGVNINGSVSKNTDFIIVKDLNDDTSKAEKARELGVKMMTPDMFRKYITDLV